MPLPELRGKRMGDVMNCLEDLDMWIQNHEEEMVEDIRKLVRIPSVSRKGNGNYLYGKACFEVAACMEKIAEGYGLETEDCGGHCIRIHYGVGNKKVEVWNHLDVVPEGKGWVYEPYACQREGDFLIGRGVSDNKGAAIAVLYAIRYLKEYGIKLHYSLSQICGLSEETGMEDARWYVSEYGSPDFAMIADCRFPLCYGEKSRCRIKVVSKRKMKHIVRLSAGIVPNSVAGSVEAVFCSNFHKNIITAKGVAGHAAAPERCINPIGILAKMINEKKDLDLSEPEKKLFEFLEAACSDGYGEGLGLRYFDETFGRMSCAGTVLRLEEGRVSLQFDMRIPPSVDVKEVIAEFKRKAFTFEMEVTDTEIAQGYMRDLHSHHIQALLSAYYMVSDRKEQPYVMGGNTYARFFENAVGFGPGIIKDYSMLQLPKGHGGGHACDEVQSVNSLCTAVKIYVTALWNLEKMYLAVKTPSP